MSERTKAKFIPDDCLIPDDLLAPIDFDKDFKQLGLDVAENFTLLVEESLDPSIAALDELLQGDKA
jgi:hypothetical protein